MRPGAVLLQADARALPLPDASVQCVVTSPPYWGLRDYGVPNQLGLERTPAEYVANLVAVFREVRRVLREDGTCWLNLGDSYANDGKWGGSTGGKHVTALHGNTSIGRQKVTTGLKPKDLVGIPWRVAFALQADGWWLRSDIVWAKPNPMPESITDRPTKAHEYLFLLTKATRYYYDAEAIKEASTGRELFGNCPGRTDENKDRHDGGRQDWSPTTSRNRRSVWTIATEPYPEAHFATFPEKLVEPCVLAGTSARGACPMCGAPWEREVQVEYVKSPVHGKGSVVGRHYVTGANNFDGAGMPRLKKQTETLGWSPSCDCPPAKPVLCRVLDPFAGSGTTVAVAERLGRVGIGVELKAEYLTLARRRTAQAGLL